MSAVMKATTVLPTLGELRERGARQKAELEQLKRAQQGMVSELWAHVRSCQAVP